MTSGGVARPVGFFLLMLGFGLRLDTTWQLLALVILTAGAVVAGTGLRGLAGPGASPALSSVPEPGDNAAPSDRSQTGETTCVPRSA